MPAMAVEWTDDPTAFVGRDWTDLVREDPDGTFFHTPRYLKLYWEEFGPAGLQLAFVRGGGETVAAAAFEIREGRASFLGGLDVTDYMGPVGLPSARERAAKDLMIALAARDDWEHADLRGLPEEGAWLTTLEAAARDAGLVPSLEEDGVAPLLPLPGSFEEYLVSLPSKPRHEIRRKERRLRDAMPSVRLVDAGPETISTDLGRFVEWHRSSPGPKGKFMHPGMELFFRRLAGALLADGAFRLSFLEAEGRRLAGAVGFRFDDGLYLYNSAYDHDLGALAPGMVLVAELIRDAIAAGCRSFDMLKGDLDYKYRFGARPRRIAALVLRRT